MADPALTGSVFAQQPDRAAQEHRNIYLARRCARGFGYLYYFSINAQKEIKRSRLK